VTLATGGFYEACRRLTRNLTKEEWKQSMGASDVSLPSSHASLISRPGEIANLIMEAAKAAARD
jgi:hypothetical protein